MKHTKGGVPAFPIQRFVDDFPNLEPGRHARKTFFFWSVGFSVVAGYVLAKWYCDWRPASNQWMNRPELKPYAAMIPDEYQGKDTVAYKTMLEQEYWSQRQKDGKADTKRSSWYRYFFANDADFTIKSNPYAKHNKWDVYNPNDGYYVNPRGDFSDHIQK